MPAFPATEGTLQMHKRIPIIVVIVVVLLCLPFITGMLTESHVRQRLAAMSSNPVVIAELQSYDRGWFTSTARIDIGLSPQYVAQLQADGPPPGADFLSQRLSVLVEFAHGPIAIRDGAHFGMSKVIARADPDTPVAAALRERFGMPYLFEFRGRAGFGGGLDFDADVPPIDHSDDGSELTFSGLRADGSLDDDRLIARANIEALDYSNPFVSAVVDAVRTDADYEFRPDDLALGSFGLTIERIVVSSGLLGTEPIFNATGLNFSSDIGIDAAGTDMHIGVNYGAEAVAAGARFALADADIGMALGELDAAAMQQYYSIMRRTAAASAADAGQMLTELAPVIDRLLERGPSLRLDPIRFSLNGEPLSANVLIETNPGALPASGVYDVDDPALWLAYATLQADANVSKALAETLAVQFARTQLAAFGGETASDDDLDAMAEAQGGFLLVSLAGQGLIVDMGDTYVTNVRFGAGELTVNGTLVPLGLP
jgi:uncharacterized protein YdgA (DUF945 family)